jgi:hypothetical protein
MKLEQFKEAITSILRERSINAISKLQQDNLDKISKALDFYKKNKHTDKREPFIKLLKKLGDEKKKLAKELDNKVSGMYKDAEYKGESVVKEGALNEMKVVNKQTGKDITKHLLDYMEGKIDKKKFEKLTGLKKESVVKEESINEMAMGFDTMTGLFYLKGVPFTKERIKEVVLFMKSSKPKTSSNQFEMTSALIIKDKVNKGKVTIDSKNLKTLIEAFKRYKNLASDKDFN